MKHEEDNSTVKKQYLHQDKSVTTQYVLDGVVSTGLGLE